MKLNRLAAVLILAFSSTTYANSAPGAFPLGPDTSLTPGSLCEHPNKIRYPEKIPYCSRDVDRSVKLEVMAEYDQKLGYRVTSMNRSDFKIDHYIPLCMGGSNEPTNLWPQHKSIFDQTDKLEAEACIKMAQGKLLQAKAVELMREAKANLDQVQRIRDYVNGL
jgi:hypothetical protein